MKKLVLLNEDNTKIGEIKVNPNIKKNKKPLTKLEKLPFQPLLDNNILGGGVLTPYNDDYIIRNLSKIVPLVTTAEDNINGQLYFETLFLKPYDDFKNIFDRVYNTGKTEKVNLMYYDDDKLLITFIDTIFKYQNSIIISINYENEFETLFQNENNLLNNSNKAMAFIIDNQIYKCNQSFADLFQTPKEKLINSPYPKDKVILQSTKPDKFMELTNKIKNREKYNFTDKVKILQKDGERWAILNIIPKTIHNQLGLHFTFIDITNLKEKELKAIKLQDDLEFIQENILIAIGSCEENKITWTSEIYKILDIPPNKFPKNTFLIKQFLIPKDKILWESYLNSEEITSFKDTLQVITYKNNKKYLSINAKTKFDNNGKIKSKTAFIQDITEMVIYQKRLEKTTTELSQTLEEKDILVKEVHHRVKNNLQIILSLMNLENAFNKNDPESVIESTRNRINFMANLHEIIYKSADLETVNIADYLPDIGESLINLYSNPIEFNTSLEDAKINLDIAIPLGLILTEFINNTIKYAFPNGEKGTFYLKFHKINNMGIVSFIDDGVGLPEDFDLNNLDSLGFTVIKTLTKQINGKLEEIKNVKGTCFEIKFPIKKMKK